MRFILLATPFAVLVIVLPPMVLIACLAYTKTLLTTKVMCYSIVMRWARIVFCATYFTTGYHNVITSSPATTVFAGTYPKPTTNTG